VETTEHVRRAVRPATTGTLGLPSGWFVVASSAELAPGASLTRPFMSEELVVYRTQRGEARAVSPYCPHLGAHLGRNGRVEGETIRCDFHGFCFDGRGACVKTAYGTRPPPAAQLPVRHVREQHGSILVWHDPAGGPPTWEVPLLDVAGWSPFQLDRHTLRGHPQETSENSVDLGHLGVVHGYHGVKMLAEPRVDGAHLYARYEMKRPVGPLGRIGIAIHTSFDVAVHGFGYSLVEATLVRFDTRVRFLVASTPTEADRIQMTLGTSVQEPRALGAAAGPLARAILPIVASMFRADVQQDFPIWEHKRYVPRPALAQGDGPLALYRRWAAQFYPA
jgi:nitrite reductase/ring-hydroxylating ferredoxin subunit